MFALQRPAGASVYGADLRTLRRSALAVGVAVLGLVFASREALDLYRGAIGPLGKGSLAVLAVTYLITGALAASALAWIMIGFSHALRPTALRVIALSAAATIVFIPAAYVVLLGEYRSRFWYVVFLVFLPAGLLAGAQLALAGVSSGLRRSDAALSSFAILALPGAVATSLIIPGFFYARFAELNLVGLAFAFLAVACNLIVAVRSTSLIRQSPPSRSAQSS